MIILDASAATEIVRGTPQGRAFEMLMLDGEEVSASTLFHAEIRNVFWKYTRFYDMPEQEAVDHVIDAVALVDEFCPMSEYGEEALLESLRWGHSVYDMFYLCAARRKGATLLTADRKLMRLCQEAGVDCVCEVGL